MKKRKTKIIHRNPWWDYKVDLTPINNGRETGYYYGDSHGNSMIIPITKNGKFILIKQRRYLRNKMSWEFPSGWISCGETPRQTAHRELEEESCHQTKELHILKRFEVLPGIFKNTCYLFVAKKVEKIDDRLKKIELVIDQLQMSVIRKSGNQEQNIEDIKSEMKLMQNSFGKIINPLTDEVRKIESEIREENSKKVESIKDRLTEITDSLKVAQRNFANVGGEVAKANALRSINAGLQPLKDRVKKLRDDCDFFSPQIIFNNK